MTQNTEIIIADNQDITCAGLIHACMEIGTQMPVRVEDKGALMERLAAEQRAVVIMDYTLFDVNDIDELLILSQRFADTRWLIFSEDLSRDFVRRLLVMSAKFGIVLKDSTMFEIKTAIRSSMNGTRFVCQRMTELMMLAENQQEEKIALTPTETEILKDIALGMTTREIAEKRFSSFHTVNTHRKNIFRKLGVNNVHEATKYALRAGLIDSAEYCI